jgi:hypothetical protein
VARDSPYRSTYILHSLEWNQVILHILLGSSVAIFLFRLDMPSAEATFMGHASYRTFHEPTVRIPTLRTPFQTDSHYLIGLIDL